MTSPKTDLQFPALEGYASPLAGRYSSRRMQAIWSPRRKFEMWRKIWLALAQAQHELGLGVTKEQVEAIHAHLEVTEGDLARAAEHEHRLRHDVMAHVHALGDVAPEARAIIHLGATSGDINCNTEIPLIKDSLALIATKTARLIGALTDLAIARRDLPCLGFTHYQPAQPTTFGKRCAMWASDLAICLDHLESVTGSLALRGIKGATGTQASFLDLFGGDAQKVREFEVLVARKLGWPAERLLIATGQTYPRVVDAIVISASAACAASCHKLATDLRLLCNHQEVDEPFEHEQIGSSAMPYKRNPMRCERACSLARLVMSLPTSALHTAATQWLERTLDDSANRRIVLPESFLALDGVLDLMHDVIANLEIHEGAIRRNLEHEMPFLASERLMLEATTLGRDRQEVHEAIRRHAQDAAQRIKSEGGQSDLLERLRAEPLLDGVAFDDVLDPARYVGLAPDQVDRFVSDVASPIASRYRDSIASLDDSAPSV